MTNPLDLRPEDEDLLRIWMRAVLEPAKRRYEMERNDRIEEWERAMDSINGRNSRDGSDRPLTPEKLREITALHQPGRIDPRAAPLLDLAVYGGVALVIALALLTMWRFSP